MEPELQSSSEQLIAATTQLLIENPNLDISLKDIAARSGFNAAMVAYHFGSKNGLLLAVLDRHAKSGMRAFENLTKSDLPAAEKLKTHIKGVLDSYFHYPYLNRLIHYMVEEDGPETAGYINKIYIKPMIDCYEEIVRQGTADGSIKHVRPEFLYYSIIGACDHFMHASYSFSATMGRSSIDDTTKDAYIEYLTGTFLHGLRAKA